MTVDIDFATFDPVTDPRFPRISAPDPDLDQSLAWPESWGEGLTERDASALILAELEERGQISAPRVRAAVPSLTDYRMASSKGWGAGWPTCSGVASFGTAVVTAARSGVRMSVNRRIAVLVDTLLDRMEARGYLCKSGQCGGYNCRPIGGTRTPSNHSWALALDLNWTDNPYTTSGRFSMPLWVPREIWNPYGFAWGGDYSGARRDYMHVEFLGTPAQADEMTRKLLGSPAPAPSPTVSTGGGRLLELKTPALEGDDVRAVQRVLRAWYALPAAWVDGVYGPGTVDYVRRAQRGTPPSPVLDGDGVVGPATRRKLGLPA